MYYRLREHVENKKNLPILIFPEGSLSMKGLGNNVLKIDNNKT